MNKRVKLTGQQINVQGGSMGWTHVRRYWTARPFLLSVLIVIAFVSPFLGFFIDGVLRRVFE